MTILSDVMLHLEMHLNVDFSPLEKLKCQLKILKTDDVEANTNAQYDF